MSDNEYIDKLGKREERIRAQDTAALIEEFKDKHSGNVALIRQELQDRYKSGRDRKTSIVVMWLLSDKSCKTATNQAVIVMQLPSPSAIPS